MIYVICNYEQVYYYISKIIIQISGITENSSLLVDSKRLSAAASSLDVGIIKYKVFRQLILNEIHF